MESLDQLLGDGVAISDISKHSPRDKLILCYILANSLLCFYPGSWFQTQWSSSKIYFSSASSTLSFPYLAVELQQPQKGPESPPHHMQYHLHPTILALGIIFLEIATGSRFARRSHEQVQWKQCNSDGRQAWQQLEDLEMQGKPKGISPALKNVIRSCLRLKPPPDFPSQNLLEEGPIRHYILSYIVQPLALELRDGHKVGLKELHDALVLEEDTDPNERGEQIQENSSPRSSVTAGDIDPLPFSFPN